MKTKWETENYWTKMRSNLPKDTVFLLIQEKCLTSIRSTKICSSICIFIFKKTKLSCYFYLIFAWPCRFSDILIRFFKLFFCEILDFAERALYLQMTKCKQFLYFFFVFKYHKLLNNLEHYRFSTKLKNNI